MVNKTLDQLLREHSSAKKKMILGIIFTSVALFLSYVGIILSASGDAGIIPILLSLPGYGVGIPNLIIGIIRSSKLNSQIAAKRREVMGANPVPVQTYSQEPVMQPQVQNTAAPVITPTPVEVTVESAQPEAAPEAAPEAEQQSGAEDTSKEFVDIDWQKYAPLDAGISYNPEKDYRFHRADGFAGSVPQRFVNNTFPRCPMCRSAEPYWTIAQHNQMSWKGNLYLFKCSCCDSIISMSMPDVTTDGRGPAGVIANPNVGLTNMLVKGKSGKKVGVVYAVIESVGTSGVDPNCQGKEFELPQIQEMSYR